MLENDKLCKKLEVYKKIINDLKLTDAIVVANIEDNYTASIVIIEPWASNVCICKQQSHYLYFSNQMVH